jgi:hypothetical protein
MLIVSMHSENVSDSLTPEFEIRESDTTFTDTATNIGTSISYSGTDVNGSTLISGLDDNKSYHRQARVKKFSGHFAVVGTAERQTLVLIKLHPYFESLPESIKPNQYSRWPLITKTPL